MQVRWGASSRKKILFENCVDDSQPTVHAITATIWSGIINSCLADLLMIIRIVVSPMKEISCKCTVKSKGPFAVPVYTFSFLVILNALKRDSWGFTNSEVRTSGLLTKVYQWSFRPRAASVGPLWVPSGSGAYRSTGWEHICVTPLFPCNVFQTRKHFMRNRAYMRNTTVSLHCFPDEETFCEKHLLAV